MIFSSVYHICKLKIIEQEVDMIKIKRCDQQEPNLKVHHTICPWKLKPNQKVQNTICVWKKKNQFSNPLALNYDYFLFYRRE